ncbi:hypothetical protein NHQ30_010923 [Ciborinia camelliae]|nr:hypothetical protein NHQ30_010923 [Ciborinia camelliae]
MDYAPIALQATDVFLDKHFHKIPDKAFRKETYKPRVPFKASRRRRREEKERRNSRDQGQDQDQDQGESRDRGVQRRQEEAYDDPEIEEAGYDSEPDYSSRQRETNMKVRDWDSRGEGDGDRDRDIRDIPRHSGAGAGAGGSADYGYGHTYEESNRSNNPPHLPYSQQPPHIRPEYLPKYDGPPQFGTASQNPYNFSPAPTAPFPEWGSGKEGRDEDPSAQYVQARTRRPKPIQRSSSYDAIHRQHARHPSSDSDSEPGRSTREHHHHRRPRSDHGHGAPESRVEHVRERAECSARKDEVRGLFTDSGAGIAGGAIGALVGGWATGKFCEARVGRERERERERGERARILTLLGAAAGGLVANAVVDRWQDGKEVAREKQKSWDERFPDGKKVLNCERVDRDRDRDRDRNGKSERGRRDSVRSRDISHMDRDRDRDSDRSWERHMI